MTEEVRKLVERVLMELRKKVETCLTLLGHISLVGVLCSGNSMMEELRKFFE